MHLTHILLLFVSGILGTVAVIERLNAVFTVLMMLNNYLEDVAIFCDHRGKWNQMMIDKLTADIKRTKTSIYCLIVPPIAVIQHSFSESDSSLFPTLSAPLVHL